VCGCPAWQMLVERCDLALLKTIIIIIIIKTPGPLFRISNFHNLYRSDCRLTCWNQNCDIPIRFRTPLCQMNEYRTISAESQHNFHFLPHFNAKLLNWFWPFFTRSRAVSGAINACIYRTIVHFVSDHESEDVNFDVGKNRPKLIGYHSSPLDCCESCQFYNLHIYIYQ